MGKKVEKTNQDDISTRTSTATIRRTTTADGRAFETDDTVSSITSLHPDSNSINKHRLWDLFNSHHTNHDHHQPRSLFLCFKGECSSPLIIIKKKKKKKEPCGDRLHGWWFRLALQRGYRASRIPSSPLRCGQRTAHTASQSPLFHIRSPALS